MSAALVTVRSLILVTATAAALLYSTARAVQPPNIVRIGVLVSLGDASAEAGLREGLSELGYSESRNLNIDWRRYAESTEAIRSAASDLVQSRVDLIVALSSPSARAALSLTSTIPVVFISADPVGAGLAASLAHPGANATGVSGQSTDLEAKRLQLLLEIASLTRDVTMLVNPDSPLYPVFLEQRQKVARALRIRIGTLNARNADETRRGTAGDRAPRGQRIHRHLGHSLSGQQRRNSCGDTQGQAASSSSRQGVSRRRHLDVLRP
jgi:putative ABC transport system substrate-binding protein